MINVAVCATMLDANPVPVRRHCSRRNNAPVQQVWQRRNRLVRLMMVFVFFFASCSPNTDSGGKKKRKRQQTAAEKSSATRKSNNKRNKYLDEHPLRSPMPLSEPFAFDPPKETSGTRKKGKLIARDTVPWALITLLGKDGLETISQWIRANLRTPKAPNLTAKMLADELNSASNLLGDHKVDKLTARALFRFLGYEWKKLKNGYYRSRTLDMDVVYHRDQVIVLAELIDTHPHLFRLVYMDESGMRRHLYQQFAWCLEEADEFDARKSTGKGTGVNLVDFMDLSGPLFMVDPEDDENSIMVGRLLETAKSKADVTKVTSNVFLETLKEACVAIDSVRAEGYYLEAENEEEDTAFALATRLSKEDEDAFVNDGVGHVYEADDGNWNFFPVDNRIMVFYMDGAGIHLSMAEGSWNPLYMNKKKATAEKPNTLLGKFQELGLTWPKKLNIEGARDLLLRHEEFKKQKIAAEVVAAEHDGLVLIGPCASPWFNAKENHYRYLKVQLSKYNGLSLEEFKEKLEELIAADDMAERASRWFKRAQGFRWWFFEHQGEAIAAPTEREIDRQMRVGELTGERIGDAVANLMEALGNPTKPEEVNLEKLTEYFHATNVKRYRSKRRKKQLLF